MLEHANPRPAAPKRAVILGAGGFVGGAAARRLAADGIDVAGLTRKDIDLLAADAAATLAPMLNPDDALVVVAAIAPCKTNAMLVDNMTMMAAVCDALGTAPVAHVVYISSDAVYADGPVPLTEQTPTAPESLHGVMHLTREIMLQGACPAPLAILRPSLLYGADDPHNGYGPNRFRRLAVAGSDIVLFGDGEERRDHVLIDDLAEIIRLALVHRSHGTLNVATGEVSSFRQVAEQVAAHFPAPPAIKGSTRHGPMPHNGYRPFDAAATGAAFPEFHYTALADGLAKTHREARETT